MAIWVEALALGIDARHAVALEHVEQFPLRDLHAVEEALQRRILARRLRGHVLDGAAEIVADGQHVAGEIGNGVAGDVVLLTLGAATKILHVRHGAQQPIAHVGILGDEGL